MDGRVQSLPEKNMIRVTMGYDVRLAESTVEPGSAGAATYYTT